MSIRNRVRGFISLVSKERPLEIRLFYLFYFFYIGANIVSTVICIIGDAPGELAMTIVTDVVVALVVVICHRHKAYRAGSIIGIFLVCCVLFPYSFFRGGGFDGGVPACCVLASLFIPLMLKGPEFYIMLVFYIAEITACYVIGYLRPELINLPSTAFIGLIDTTQGFIVSALAASLMIKFQNGIYIAEKKKADEATRIKSDFLASVSHEIRTPMNAVIGMTEILLRRDLSEEAYHDVADIQRAGKNLLSIINDILDFSKIEAGKFEIIESDYDPGSLLNDCVNIAKARLAGKPVRFITDFDPDLPGRLNGDFVRVRQVLINLLSNAAKYTREGSVTLRVYRKENDFYFSVIDTGIGIKPEDMEKLFGAFNQVDSGSHRGIEGTGLGLAITRQLCSLMGGEVTMKSEYGKGSEFTARIPQKIVDTRPMVLDIRPAMDGRAYFEAAFTAPGFKVLAVDDLETNLQVVRGLLAPYEIDITLCSSGVEAVNRVKQETFDLVLMDHMMPDMGGIEAAAQIREWEKYRTLSPDSRMHIPIIALTANAVAGMREMFLEKGFDDYLSKPIDIETLDALMQKWIPEEKKHRGGPRRGASAKKAAPLEALRDAGINIEKGIARTSGSIEGYLSILRIYYRDTEKRLAALEDLTDIKNSVIIFHALKGLNATIGADSVSALAAELEEMCRAGNEKAVREKIPAFVSALAAVRGAIGKTLADRSAD